MRLALATVGALALLLLAAHAAADVVAGPEPVCPPGTTARTDHRGHYCQPSPPESCPPGHLARVSRDQAYCEPPPPAPCPLGSYWSSRSATDAACRAYRRCDLHRCGSAAECVDTAFCVIAEQDPRRISEIVVGTCEDSECSGEARCVKAQRCTPKGALPRPRASTTADSAPPATSDAAAPAPVGGDGVGGGAPVPACGCGCRLHTSEADDAGGSLALASLFAFVVLRRRRLTRQRGAQGQPK